MHFKGVLTWAQRQWAGSLRQREVFSRRVEAAGLGPETHPDLPSEEFVIHPPWGDCPKLLLSSPRSTVPATAAPARPGHQPFSGAFLRASAS